VRYCARIADRERAERTNSLGSGLGDAQKGVGWQLFAVRTQFLISGSDLLGLCEWSGRLAKFSFVHIVHGRGKKHAPDCLRRWGAGLSVKIVRSFRLEKVAEAVRPADGHTCGLSTFRLARVGEVFRRSGV